MPAPHPVRGPFLKYLREQFPYKQDFTDPKGNVYSYEQIKQGISEIRHVNYELNEALFYFTKSRLPRTQIADTMNVDSTTYKRKLNKACDLVLEYVNHKTLLGSYTIDIDDKQVKFDDVTDLTDKIMLLESFLKRLKDEQQESNSKQ